MFCGANALGAYFTFSLRNTLFAIGMPARIGNTGVRAITT